MTRRKCKVHAIKKIENVRICYVNFGFLNNPVPHNVSYFYYKMVRYYVYKTLKIGPLGRPNGPIFRVSLYTIPNAVKFSRK